MAFVNEEADEDSSEVEQKYNAQSIYYLELEKQLASLKRIKIQIDLLFLQYLSLQ